jgi:hypothetical protein
MRITSQNEETNRCSYFCGDLCFCPTDRAAIADAAVKWITLAANLGDKQGQANLADVCLEDKLVKQDLIEAYKWGGVAPLEHQSDFVLGRINVNSIRQPFVADATKGCTWVIYGGFRRALPGSERNSRTRLHLFRRGKRGRIKR